MFDLDGLAPGPFDDALLPLGPAVATPGLFEGRVDVLLGTLRGSDGPLQSAAHRAGDDVPADLRAFYASTVSTAAAAHATEVRGGSQSIADSLTDSGEDVAVLRASVLRYLPPPTAAIGAGLDPPPDPGVIQHGHGFENPPPPASTDPENAAP